MANFKTLFSGRLKWFMGFCAILFLALGVNISVNISVQAADPPVDQAAQRAADLAEQAVEKAAQQAADKAAQQAADKAAQQAADKAAQQAADKAAQQAADKAAQQAADKAAQQAADKAAQQAADKAIQQAADKAAQQAADKAAQQAADKATQQAADKATQQAADKAAQQAADKATQQAADKAAQQAADKATQQAADKATQQAADKATQQAADKAAQEAADKATQQAADKAAQQVADKATQEAADKAAQQTAAKAAQATAAKAAQAAAAKAAQATAAKAAQAAAAKAAQAAAAKAAQAAAAKAAEETAAKAAQEAAAKAAQEAAAKAAQEAAAKAAQAAAAKAAQAKAAKEAAEKMSHQAAAAKEAAEKTSHQVAKETAEKAPHQTASSSDSKKKLSSVKTGRALDTLDSAIDRHREFKGIYNDNGDMAVNGEILVLARKTTDLTGKDRGYHIRGQRYLKGLGMVLTRVEAPKGKKLSKSASELSKDMKNSRVDLNYLFSPAAHRVSAADKAYSVANFARKENLNFRNITKIRLGLIDTMVDRSHPALLGGAITSEDFVPYELKRPEGHGTAIASLLIGDEPSVFRGLVPGAKLSAASVFFRLPSGKITATTESLILALDWLVRQKVQVINMSLSGPPNSLLAVAIKRVAEKGIITVAAVGNGGPAAAPLFPAAYPGVVAVTAVNKDGHVYLRANRGSYIAFSAPGVNVLAAHSGGGYRALTGTSIAAPFVSAIVAEEANANRSLNQDELVKFLEKNTIDLGKAGFDDTYGYGLIQAVSPQ